MFVMPCAIVALLLLCLSFLCSAHWFRPDLDPMVFVAICTPWPTSKGLDHPYLHVYACLLLCFMLVIASLVLGFAKLDALNGLVVVWLHSTPTKPCLDVTTWDGAGCFVHTFFPFLFRAMVCLPCLFMPPVGFLCISICLLTCSCMSLSC